MSKVIWISNAIISLVISLIINLNAKSVGGFLIGTLFLALIIFGILTLIIKSIQNIKEKNTKKTILFSVLSVIAIAIFSYGYIIFSSGGGCFTSLTPPHFRTNILTGKCNYGGGATCLSSDPWYYKPDCDSDAEKIKIIENTTWYDNMLQRCNRFCDENMRERYCHTMKGGSLSNGPSAIECSVITTCNSISCD